MTLFVSLPNGTSIQFKNGPDALVYEIKHLIEAKTGISSSSQKLSFGNVDLEDHKMLGDYKIGLTSLWQQ